MIQIFAYNYNFSVKNDAYSVGLVNNYNSHGWLPLKMLPTRASGFVKHVSIFCFGGASSYFFIFTPSFVFTHSATVYATLLLLS